MIVEKVLQENEHSIKNDYFFFYNLKENGSILHFTKYKKEAKDSIDESFVIDEFNEIGESIVMSHPSNENIALTKKGEENIDLENINPRLDSTNANLLYGISSTADIGLYNRDIETYVSKLGNEHTRSIANHSIVFNIVKPTKNQPVSNLIIHSHNNDEVYVNIDGCVTRDTYPTIVKLSLKLTGSDSVSPDGTSEYDVQLIDLAGNNFSDQVDVYLKANAGVLSHNKLTTDENGYCKFRFKADMLLSGESAEIKVGFKYFSNITNKLINII